MKKPSRKTLIRKLDKAVREVVLKRDKNRCFTPSPSCNGIMTAGHLFSRAAYSTRWDLRNVMAQCSSHNLLHEYRPEVMTLAYIKKFGLPAYEELYREHWKVRKWSNKDLRILLKEYGNTKM